MKRKDLQSLRTKDRKALEKFLNEKKLELINARMAIKVGKEKNLRRVKNLRQDIAQLLTVIREKEIMKKEG